MRSASRQGLLAGCAVLLAASASAAQTSGSVALTPGFVPDPQRLSGISGGPIQANTLDPNCRGYIGQQPNHAVVINSGLQFLRTFVESTGDTTLLIRAPNGQMFCADDTYGFNPGIDAAYGPGTYLIWVGSYSQGASAPYTVSFSELRSTRPGAQPGGMPGIVAPQIPVMPPPGRPSIATAVSGFGGRIFDYHTTSAIAVIRQSCRVAGATVSVRGNHTFMSDMTVRLRSPSGETATLQSHQRTSVFRTYSTPQFNGSQGAGAWMLSIEDSVGADSGVLSGFSVLLRCM